MCVTQRIMMFERNPVFFRYIRQSSPENTQRASLFKVWLYFIIVGQRVTEAVGIKTNAVRNHHLVFDVVLHILMPDDIKCRSILRIFWFDVVHFYVFVEIRIVRRSHKPVYLFYYLTFLHPYEANLTNTGGVPCGSFEVNRCKGFINGWAGQHRFKNLLFFRLLYGIIKKN